MVTGRVHKSHPQKRNLCIKARVDTASPAGDLRNGHFYHFARIRSEAACGAVTAASFGMASLKGIAVGPWAHDMILVSESV